MKNFQISEKTFERLRTRAMTLDKSPERTIDYLLGIFDDLLEAQQEEMLRDFELQQARDEMKALKTKLSKGKSNG